MAEEVIWIVTDDTGSGEVPAEVKEDGEDELGFVRWASCPPSVGAEDSRDGYPTGEKPTNIFL